MVSERIARRAIEALRRSRFMPAGSVDRVVDSEALSRRRDASIVVYFPTAPNTLYQVRAWYAALLALHAVHPLLVVCRDSRSARSIREESGLDAVSVGTLAQLADVFESLPAELVLYPNLDVLDFEALSFTGPAHVYIGHGDSDKAVFASHQVAAFDRYFVATEESVRRVADDVLFYDAFRRCVVVGEPQADVHAWHVPPATDPRIVVYAPTWEGAVDSDAHSSLVSHGGALVDALLTDGRFAVIYRPHPLTGSRDPAHAAVDAAVRRQIADRRQEGHRVDTGPDLVGAFTGAAALICDVSAVASQWRPSGRPLVVLRPGDATIDGTIAELDRQLAGTAPAIAGRGQATSRFIDACTRTMVERKQEIADRGAPERPT